MAALIKWGILGLGKIAQKFASDLILVEDCELTAVASSNEDRAKIFAKEFGVNTFYGDISPNSGSKIFVNSRPALSFDFEKRFGKVIGLQLMAIKGELADHYYPKSFITKFIKSNLNIILNTDNYFDNKHNFKQA